MKVVKIFNQNNEYIKEFKFTNEEKMNFWINSTIENKIYGEPGDYSFVISDYVEEKTDSQKLQELIEAFEAYKAAHP